MEHPCTRCCPSCCGCYCSLALVRRLRSFAGPRLSPPVVLPPLVYPRPVVLVDPRRPPFVLAAVRLLAPPVVFSPARLPPLGCAGSPRRPPFVLAPVRLLAPVCPRPLCLPPLVYPRSAVLVHPVGRRSCSPPFVCWLPFVPARCVCPRSFTPARLYRFTPSAAVRARPRSFAGSRLSPPVVFVPALFCVCIKYISTYIMKLLTFIS